MKEQSVQTLDRTLDIIELLAISSNGMGVTEIGLKLNLHKSTVHRLANALMRRGYIEKEKGTGLYKIGFKFLEISSLHMHQLELKAEAAPIMRRLAELTGQVTHLAILDNTEVVYIEKIDVIQSLRLYSQIGKRIPAYCSALGKILLTGQNNTKQKFLIENMEFIPYTEKTIKNKKALLDELERTQQRGWAIDDEEHEEGIRCIAAPVKDFTGRVIAALSISGDKNVVSLNRYESFSRFVMNAAKEISKRMGAL